MLRSYSLYYNDYQRNQHFCDFIRFTTSELDCLNIEYANFTVFETFWITNDENRGFQFNFCYGVLRVLQNAVHTRSVWVDIFEKPKDNLPT